MKKSIFQTMLIFVGNKLIPVFHFSSPKNHELDVGTYLDSLGTNLVKEAVFLLLILCSRISTSLSELSSSNLRVTTSEVLILLFDAWFEKSLEDLFSDLHSLCEFPVPDWLDPPV